MSSYVSGEVDPSLGEHELGNRSMLSPLQTHQLYTDDEEHTFTVRRPVIFNGIPGDLTERSDLASRTIKLEIPRITKRRTKSDLEREFEAIWPGVFGALLNGLVGGLRDQGSIVVDDPRD